MPQNVCRERTIRIARVTTGSSMDTQGREFAPLLAVPVVSRASPTKLASVTCRSARTVKRHHFGFVLLAGALAACGADATSPLGTHQAAIEGGQVDDASTSVFRVLTRASGFEELCSATLIAPQLMLTARHCIAETNSGSIDCDRDRFGNVIPTSEIKFSNATEPDLFSNWFDAVHIATSQESDYTCGYDIAVVVLAKPVPRSVAIPAEPRFAPLIQTGEVYKAVGYGASSADEARAEFGIRHSRAGLAVACGQDRRCESWVSSREFVGGGGACHGDSGGPAFDAHGRVIGVLSRGAEGCNSPVYTGVPAYEALLVETAQLAQTQFGVPLPVWAGGEKEPERSDEDTRGEETADAGTSPPSRTTLSEESGCAMRAVKAGSQGALSVSFSATIFTLLALVFMGRARRRQ